MSSIPIFTVSSLLSAEQESNLLNKLHHAKNVLLCALSHSTLAMTRLLHLARLDPVGILDLSGHKAIEASRLFVVIEDLHKSVKQASIEDAYQIKDSIFSAICNIHLSFKTIHELCRFIESIKAGKIKPSSAKAILTAEKDYLAIKDKLVYTNTRLVWHICKRFKGRGLPQEDLFQEGCLGLIRAIELYNPEHSARLATYATWWIRWGITSALYNGNRVVHLTTQRIRQLNKVNSVIKSYLTNTGEVPTPEVIAKEIGVSVTLVDNLLLMGASSVSMEACGEDDISLHDTLADENSPQPGTDLDANLEHTSVHHALTKLRGREAEIIRMRYGFNDEGKHHTLREVGSHYGVSHERIRQIEEKAMGRLRVLGVILQLR